MLSPRRVLALLMVLTVAVLAVMLWRYFQQQAPEELLEALPKQVDLSLDELHYTQNEGGKRSWTLAAKRAEYQRESGTALLDDVQMTLYDAGRFGEVRLQAEHGQLQQAERQVTVWGQVEVDTSEGQRLLTERLHYDDARRLLTTQEPIRFSAPRLELTGRGLEVNVETGQLQVKDDVWMLLLPAEKERARR